MLKATQAGSGRAGTHHSDPKHEAFWSSMHGVPPAFSHIRTGLTSTNGATGRHQILEPEAGTGKKASPGSTAADPVVEGREGAPQLKVQSHKLRVAHQLGRGRGASRSTCRLSTAGEPGSEDTQSTAWEVCWSDYPSIQSVVPGPAAPPGRLLEIQNLRPSQTT